MQFTFDDLANSLVVTTILTKGDRETNCDSFCCSNYTIADQMLVSFEFEFGDRNAKLLKILDSSNFKLTQSYRMSINYTKFIHCSEATTMIYFAFCTDTSTIL